MVGIEETITKVRKPTIQYKLGKQYLWKKKGVKVAREEAHFSTTCFAIAPPPKKEQFIQSIICQRLHYVQARKQEWLLATYIAMDW